MFSGLFFVKNSMILKKSGKFEYLNPVYAIAEESEDGEFYYSTDLKNKIYRKYKIIEFKNKKEYKRYISMYEDLKNIKKIDLKFYNMKKLEKKINEEEKEKIKINYLDIEVIDLKDKKFPEPIFANAEITHIQNYNSENDKITIFLTKKVSKKFKEKYKNVEFLEFENEKEMLKNFIIFLKKNNFDIITAYNGDFFDFPYILNRMTNLGININHLSPIGETKIFARLKINERYENFDISSKDELEIVQEMIKNKSAKIIEYKIKIDGLYLIDFLTLMKKIKNLNLPIFTLEYVTKLFLNEGDGKISYKNYNSIYDFFEKDYDGFTEYSIRDVEVLKKLDEKLKLFKIFLKQSYMYKVPDLKMTLGTIEPWYYKLCDEFFNLKILPPKDEIKEKTNTRIEGGFVKDPIVGEHKKIFSIDYNSLYPSIISSLNISYENTKKFNELYEKNEITKDEYEFLEKCKNEDFALKNMDKISEISKKLNLIYGGFTFFEKDKRGIIANIISNIYKQRKKVKNKKIIAEIILENKNNNKFSSSEIIQKIENDEIDFNNAKNFSVIDKEKLKLYADENDDLQYVLKIMMNSLYGAITSPYFAFFDIDIGASITFLGRCLIKKTGQNFNNFNKKLLEKRNKKPVDTLIYTDTDSCYVTLEPFFDYEIENKETAKKFLNSTLKYINSKGQKLIEKTINDFIEKFNFYHKDFMGAKVEKIGLKGIWIAKKKYALLKIWDEGIEYDYDEIIKLENNKGVSVTGLEIIQSSTPDFAKKHLKKILKIILTKDEKFLQNYFKKIEEEYFQKSKENDLDFIDTIVKFQNVKEIECVEKNDRLVRYIIDGNKKKELGCPINSASAYIYNKLLKKLNLEEKYEFIKEGNKIKMIYLKKPNIVNFHSIAFQDVNFLKDAKLLKFIDYKTQFDKIIKQPLSTILEKINWDLRKKAKLF